MQDGPSGVAPRNIPLVLDVDGTLLRSDLLLETFWAAVGRDLPATVRATALDHLRQSY